MYPVIQIGQAAIQSSVLALLVALWVGITLAEREWKTSAPAAQEQEAWNVVALLIAVTIVAGRLAYVAQHPSLYLSDPLQVLSPAPNTISFGVGAVAGVLVAAAFLQQRRIPILPLLDATAPGALAAIAIIALGQFLSGDAYGMPADLPWAVQQWGEWRHPVQLYDALAAFAGWIAIRRIRGTQVGWKTLFALAWYGTARVLIDGFRGDATVIAGGYRSTQVMALSVSLLALWLMSRMTAVPVSGEQ